MRIKALTVFLLLSTSIFVGIEAYEPYCDQECEESYYVQKFNVLNDPELSSLLQRALCSNIDMRLLSLTTKKKNQCLGNELAIKVSAEIAINYITLRKIQRQIDLSSQLVSIQEKRLELFASQYNFGPGTSIEIATAQGKLAVAKATVIKLESKAKRIIYHLSTLLGNFPEALLEELMCSSVVSLVPYEICEEDVCDCYCVTNNKKSCSDSYTLLCQKAILKSQEELKAAYDSYFSEKERHELLLQSVYAYEKAFNNAKELFKTGGNLALVLNAKEALVESKNTLIENEAELALSAVAVQIALELGSN